MLPFSSERDVSDRRQKLELSTTQFCGILNTLVFHCAEVQEVKTAHFKEKNLIEILH